MKKPTTINQQQPNQLHLWFDQQSDADKRTIALNAIERLIELQEVRLREADFIDHEDGTTEIIEQTLYWTSCGEDLRCPF